MKKILLLALAATLILACKQEKKEYLPNSVGAINSISIISSNEIWNGNVGDVVREHFAAPTVGLPWDEPIFTMSQMVPKVFTGFARNSRNIFIIEKDSINGYAIKNDVYAKPQRVIYITGKTDEDLIRIINNKVPEIIPDLRQAELHENQTRFKKAPNTETVLQETFGISLVMPSIYKVAKQTDNFVWVRRETQKGNMSVLVYELPLNAFPKDSLKVDQIIKMRDSIGEAHIPGREEGMYMITEKAYAPYVSDVSIVNKQAIETRGMWEVKNFFMAGPFINYIINDQENNRTLVLEGFTFAPSVSKRDIIFELEAILKTITFIKN